MEVAGSSAHQFLRRMQPDSLIWRVCKVVTALFASSYAVAMAKGQAGSYLGGDQVAISNPSENQLDEKPAIESIDGCILGVWTRWENGEADVVGRLVCPGSTDLAAEVRINSHIPGNQMAARLAVIGDRALVVWQGDQDPDGTYGIYGRSLQIVDRKIVFSGEDQKISTTTVYDQQRPDIAVVDGAFLTAWQTSVVTNNGGKDAQGQRLDDQGVKLGTEFSMSVWYDSSQAFNNARQLRITELGSAVVTVANHWWVHVVVSPRTSHQSASDVYLAYATISGNTVRQTRALEFGLLDSAAKGVSDAKRPCIVSNNSTTATIVWDMPAYDFDGSRGIYAQQYTGGAAAASPTIRRVSSYQSGEQCCAAALVVELDKVVVAWESATLQKDGSRRVTARVVDALALKPIGREFPISEDTTGEQREVTLAKQVGGGFFAAWRQQGLIMGRAFVAT